MFNPTTFLMCQSRIRSLTLFHVFYISFRKLFCYKITINFINWLVSYFHVESTIWYGFFSLLSQVRTFAYYCLQLLCLHFDWKFSHRQSYHILFFIYIFFFDLVISSISELIIFFLHQIVSFIIFDAQTKNKFIL